MGQANGGASPRGRWYQRLKDWLFGYDFFISYHWNSGGAYAVNLAQALRDRGFDVFLDRADYAMRVGVQEGRLVFLGLVRREEFASAGVEDGGGDFVLRQRRNLHSRRVGDDLSTAFVRGFRLPDVPLDDSWAAVQHQTALRPNAMED